LSHVTYLSNQFCYSRQEDRCAANHSCVTAGPMRARHLSHVTYLSNQFCYSRQEDRFAANHSCVIAGPIRARHLSHVTYLSNQFCYSRQEDRFAANHACVLIAILLRSSDLITKLRKTGKNCMDIFFLNHVSKLKLVV